MKLPHYTLAGALFVALLILASALGTRSGLWHYATGFQLMAVGVTFGVFVVMLCVGALISARHREYRPVSLLAMVVICAGLALPLNGLYRVSQVPEIHDISTDLIEPPAFVAAAALRGTNQNPVEHGGSSVAEKQQAAYPDIRPIYLPLEASAAFQKALAAAQRMDWEIIASVPDEGRIEAVATSRWFGFKDDVVIRVRDEAPLSRIDIRSASRVGSSDLGVNAGRIQDFTALIAPR